MYKALTILGVALVLLAGIGQSVSNKRAYVAGKYAFEMDGATAFIRSTEGGGTTADVVQEPVGADLIARKHIANVKYQDITVTCSTGMTRGFYQWIQDSFDHKYSRKNGAIVAADFNYKEQSRLEFVNALITEVGFPALDAASKDAAKMTLKISPEYTRSVAGSGIGVKGSSTQKKWLPANFRLQIDGLDCSRVNKVEALTFKQKFAESPDPRVGGLVPAGFEIPCLTILLPEPYSKSFYDWHEDFVIKGNNGQEMEKGGSLEYLTPDLKTVIFTLNLMNLGIFKLSPEKSEASSENIRRVKAEMYCEDIKFSYGSGAWAIAPE